MYIDPIRIFRQDAGWPLNSIELRNKQVGAQAFSQNIEQPPTWAALLGETCRADSHTETDTHTHT